MLLNDAELRQLTGEPNLVLAARRVREWGPRVIVAKQGEYGAAMITEEGFFGLPAFPLATVVDPTGAGDSFAGGFMGYLAAHSDQEIDHKLLSSAMAYGGEEISERVSELARITQFIERPVALKG